MRARLVETVGFRGRFLPVATVYGGTEGMCLHLNGLGIPEMRPAPA